MCTKMRLFVLSKQGISHNEILAVCTSSKKAVAQLEKKYKEDKAWAEAQVSETNQANHDFDGYHDFFITEIKANSLVSISSNTLTGEGIIRCWQVMTPSFTLLDFAFNADEDMSYSLVKVSSEEKELDA